MPLCCVECKPCNGGSCLPGPGGLFKSRRRGPAQQLCRALGRMKVGGTRTRRRRRPGSFSSVRAVFWPLMSMRSEADAAVDNRPPGDDTTDVDDGASSGATGAQAQAQHAPSPSLQLNDVDGVVTVSAPGAAASTTAAGVLALQARLGAAAAAVAVAAGRAPQRQRQQQLTAKVSVAAAGDEARAIVRHGGDVEAACRSFERHLVEMLVEERKVMDLTDVEELMCCWDKLRCPAFVHLVGRFYAELCMDLFSAQDADTDDDVPSSPSEEDLSL